MKRSEFAEIVNAVALEESNKLNQAVQKASSSSQDSFAQVIAEIATSIPGIAARTTAEILVRSGVVSLEADD